MFVNVRNKLPLGIVSSTRHSMSTKLYFRSLFDVKIFFDKLGQFDPDEYLTRLLLAVALSFMTVKISGGHFRDPSRWRA